MILSEVGKHSTSVRRVRRASRQSTLRDREKNSTIWSAVLDKLDELVVHDKQKRLFTDAQATDGVLDFLISTRVGRLPGVAMFGVMEEESGTELELWAEDEGPVEEGDEGGPGPP